MRINSGLQSNPMRSKLLKTHWSKLMRRLPPNFPIESISARRDFMLRLGQLGGTGLALPALLEATAAQAATEITKSQPAPPKASTGGKAKACILIYLWGGPPQQDMWDLKPDAPDSIRSQFQPIDTKPFRASAFATNCPPSRGTPTRWRLFVL